MSSIKQTEAGWGVFLTPLNAHIGRPYPYLLQDELEDEGQMIDCVGTLLEAVEVLLKAIQKQQTDELEDYRADIVGLEKEIDVRQTRLLWADSKTDELRDTLEAIEKRENNGEAPQ